MKIKLNKDISEKLKHINEGSDTKVSSDELFKAQAKAMYIQQQKINSLSVDIKLPSDMCKPIIVPKCPIDIANLMRPISKEGKFLNIHDMVEDPVQTFNHAEDYAIQFFNNIGNLADNGNLVGADEEYKRDKTNVMPAKESYYHEGVYDHINEDGTAVDATAKLGQNIINTVSDPVTVGSISGDVIGGAIDYGLTATTVAVGHILWKTALSAGFISGVGYFGQKLFGHVTGDGRFMNNTKKLQDENLMVFADDSDLWKGENVLESINHYISSVKDSVANVLAQVSPNATKYTEFAQKLNNYIAASDKQLKLYKQQNDEIANDAQKKMMEQIQNMEKIKQYRWEDKYKFEEEVVKIISDDPNSSKNDVIKAHTVAQVFSRYVDNNNVEKMKKFKDVLNNRNTSEILNLVKESVEFNNDNVLNEAESTGFTKPEPIDVTKYYSVIKSEMANYMEEMFPLQSANNLPGYEDAKNAMKNMKEKASTEINEKIEQICNSFNNSQDQTVTGKIKEFFVHHPLQAKTLKSLWSRHETELEMRMNNRLKQMSDLRNNTRSVGWTVDICRNVVPEIIARMLAYRYVLSILKDEGYYSYTPERYKEDEQKWNDNEGNCQDQFLSEPQNMVNWVLMHLGKDYTDNGESPIVPTDNGYSFMNAMPFISLMFIQQAKTNNSAFDTSTMTNIMLLANESSKKGEDKYKDFSNEFVSMCGNINWSIDNIDEIEKIFSLSDDLKKMKSLISSTFNYINGIKCNADNANMSMACAMIINNKQLIKKYIENKDAYNNLGEKPSIEEIEKVLGKITLPEDFTNIDFKSVFEKVEDKIDYYSYILSFYDAFIKDSEIDDYSNLSPVNDIEKICNSVMAFVQIVTSGKLNIGHPVTDIEISFNNIKNNLKNYLYEGESNKLDTTVGKNYLKIAYVAAGGDGGKFDDEYKKIDKAVNLAMSQDVSVDSSAFVKNNIVQALQNPADTSSSIMKFEDLKLKEYVEGINEETLFGFIKYNESSYVLLKEPSSDNTKNNVSIFRNDIKSIIDYAINCAQTKCNELIKSNNNLLFNNICNELKIVGDNIKIENIRQAYISCGGKAENFDKALNQINKIDISKFIENLKNPTKALEYKLPENTIIPISKHDKFTGSDSLNLQKSIKDCNAVSLYDLFSTDKPNEEFKYEFVKGINEVEFIDIFKQAILYLVEYTICEGVNKLSDLIRYFTTKCIFNRTLPEYAKVLLTCNNNLQDEYKKQSADKLFINNVYGPFKKVFNNICKIYISNYNNLTDYYKIDSSEKEIFIDILRRLSQLSGKAINSTQLIIDQFSNFRFNDIEFKNINDNDQIKVIEQMCDVLVTTATDKNNNYFLFIQKFIDKFYTA